MNGSRRDTSGNWSTPSGTIPRQRKWRILAGVDVDSRCTCTWLLGDRIDVVLSENSFMPPNMASNKARQN